MENVNEDLATRKRCQCGEVTGVPCQAAPTRTYDEQGYALTCEPAEGCMLVTDGERMLGVAVGCARYITHTFAGWEVRS